MRNYPSEAEGGGDGGSSGGGSSPTSLSVSVGAAVALLEVALVVAAVDPPLCWRSLPDDSGVRKIRVIMFPTPVPVVPGALRIDLKGMVCILLGLQQQNTS